MLKGSSKIDRAWEKPNLDVTSLTEAGREFHSLAPEYYKGPFLADVNKVWRLL